MTIYVLRVEVAVEGHYIAAATPATAATAATAFIVKNAVLTIAKLLTGSA